MTTTTIRKVIDVDADKCVNCHACIAACPVKFCNDGSGDHVTINDQLCIGCGSCITACTHGARHGVDDFDAFVEAAHRHTPMVAIVAPAAASNFPERYLHLNGWLRSMGVDAFFDVSFGAELTVKSYLEYAKKEKPAAIIAQPCPAIVTYIETYRPELLSYLAPADSPMLHSIKLIRRYYPQFSTYKVVVISPCYAKKREFDETGHGDFNITYQSIDRYLSDNRLDLATFEEIDFSNAPAERAVLFSTPGGLMRTVERDALGVSRKTRKIEGPGIVYHYLDHLEDNIVAGRAPVLVDCLNCELGCNGGPGTLNVGKSPDEVEFAVEKRNTEMQKRYRRLGTTAMAAAKVRRTINRYWKNGLYDRSYVDRSGVNTIRVPSQAEFAAIYRRLHKYSEADHLNCGACGYGRCERMAIAIHNGLNKPENCFHYEKTNRKEMTSRLGQRLRESINHIAEFVRALSVTPGTISEKAGDGLSGNDSRAAFVKAATTADTTGMGRISELTRQTSEIVSSGVAYVEDTLGKMGEIQESSKLTAGGIQSLGDSIEGIGEIVGIISSIAAQTKIIAFNAELEASSAGERGKNFEIVAAEIRRLADNTVHSTTEIHKKIREIQQSSASLVAAGSTEARKIQEGWDLSNSMREILERLQEQAELSFSQTNEIIASQVGHFQATLGDLKGLMEEVDSFGR